MKEPRRSVASCARNDATVALRARSSEALRSSCGDEAAVPAMDCREKEEGGATERDGGSAAGGWGWRWGMPRSDLGDRGEGERPRGWVRSGWMTTVGMARAVWGGGVVGGGRRAATDAENGRAATAEEAEEDGLVAEAEDGRAADGSGGPAVLWSLGGGGAGVGKIVVGACVRVERGVRGLIVWLVVLGRLVAC